MNQQETHDAEDYFTVSRYSIGKIETLDNDPETEPQDDIYDLILYASYEEAPRHYVLYRTSLIKLAVDLILTATDDNDR